MSNHNEGSDGTNYVAFILRNAPKCNPIDRMSKGDCVKHLNIDYYKVDFALPQDFVNDMRKVTGRDCCHCFVWSYEGKGIFGVPRPLTCEGAEMLAAYNAHFGYSYPNSYTLMD